VDKIKKAWAWVRDRAVVILTLIVSVLVAILAYKHYRKKVGSLKDAVTVERAKREVAALESRRDALSEQAGAADARVGEIDDKIRATRRRAVAVREEVAALSDDEVLERFEELGY